MKKTTKKDMMRLQTYGAYYLSGMEPVNIEALLGEGSLETDQLEDALNVATGAGQSQPEQMRAADIVSTAFQATAVIVQTVATIVSAVGAAVSATGVGAIIGGVFIIAGTIISAVIRRKANEECDSKGCLDVKGGPEKASTNAGKQWLSEKRSRHIRAAIGINVSSDAKRLNKSNCRVADTFGNAGYGGTKSSCEAKHGYFATFTNDGMWWWGKADADKHSDCLSGTVIGVKCRVDSGATKNCHRSMYGNPETPVLEGMTDKPDKTEPSPEFLAREEAVTQVLYWMAADSGTRQRRTAGLDYELISCFQRLFRRHQGGADDYRVGTSSLVSKEYERSIAHYMGVENNTNNFGSGSTPFNMRIASRIYASIRAMFQAAVAMSNKVGEKRAIYLLHEALGKPQVKKSAYGSPDDVVNYIDTRPLKESIRAQKANTEPWPEQALAMQLGFQELKEFLRLLSQETAVQIIESQIGRQRAIIAAEAAVQGRPAGFGYGVQYSAVVRRRMQELSTNPRALGAGGLGKFSPWRIPQWMIYTGAGALVVGGIYGLIRAIRHEED